MAPKAPKKTAPDPAHRKPSDTIGATALPLQDRMKHHVAPTTNPITKPSIIPSTSPFEHRLIVTKIYLLFRVILREQVSVILSTVRFL